MKMFTSVTEFAFLMWTDGMHVVRSPIANTEVDTSFVPAPECHFRQAQLKRTLYLSLLVLADRDVFFSMCVALAGNT